MAADVALVIGEFGRTAAVALDVELLVLDRLRHPDSSNNRYLNDWLWFYDGAVRGGYEGEGLI